MAPHTVCYELDRICAPYYFTYSGHANPDREGISIIYVYWSARDTEIPLSTFTVDDYNPLEYVLTKIILQFSGGTVNA